MNRIQRRAYDREAKEIDKLVGWIEPEFRRDLFDESHPLSYISLFRAYDSGWRAVADAWNAKPSKIIEIDRNYFFNTYKPLENLKQK